MTQYAQFITGKQNADGVGCPECGYAVPNLETFKAMASIRRDIKHPAIIAPMHVVCLCPDCGHIYLLSNVGQVRNLSRHEKERMRKAPWADDCKSRQRKIVRKLCPND